MRNLRHIIWVLLIISLMACEDTSRQPKIATSQLTGVYTVELWSEHEFYEFGEPVNLRATLTNVSEDIIIFGSESDTALVMDITLRTPGGAGPEERVWSEENPRQTNSLITLAPLESYIITWTLSLSFQTSYIVETLWIDPRQGKQFETGLLIEHGDYPPMP